MGRRPIDPGIDAGRDSGQEAGPGVPADAFREALALWASGVGVLAVRDPDDGKVHAVTASSFASISARPPRIVASLGPGAQPLPFMEEGGRFVVSVLAEGQAGLATRFADAFPVGPSPFPDDGDPLVDGAHATVTCEVEQLVPVGACRLVVGLVVGTSTNAAAGPLLHYRREYRALEG